MYYLTEEDFLIAERNGISRKLAKDRFYNKCWDKEKSITHPKRNKESFKSEVIKLYPNYKERLKELGITYYTLYSRCYNMNLDIKTAMSYPKAHVFVKRGRKNVKITPEHIKKASEIGVSEYALKQRVYNLKWSVEKATTTPTFNRGQKTKK